MSENTNWLNGEPQVEIHFTREELVEIRKNLLSKHFSKWRWAKSNLKNPYFIYDVLANAVLEPSFVFEWIRR